MTGQSLTTSWSEAELLESLQAFGRAVQLSVQGSPCLP